MTEPDEDKPRKPRRTLLLVLLALALLVPIGVFGRMGIREIRRPHDYDPKALQALTDLINNNGSLAFSNRTRPCTDSPLVAEVDPDRNRVILRDDFTQNRLDLVYRIIEDRRAPHLPEMYSAGQYEALKAGYAFTDGMVVFEGRPKLDRPLTRDEGVCITENGQVFG